MRSSAERHDLVRSRVDHLFRRSAGRMVSALTRMLGSDSLDVAEEVVQEALVRALQVWPYRGIPENPEGWLYRVARNLALDRARRSATLARKLDAIVAEPASMRAPGIAEAVHAVEPRPDDEWAMVFMCCHPALPPELRITLTLKTVGGFGVREIAAAFLATEVAIAQRLVRAKRILRERNVAFEMPDAAERGERLDSVLRVLYLIFNEGYGAHEGESLVRTELCGEAIRLCALLLDRPATDRPDVHALLALMLLQSSRLPARTSSTGELLLLEEQDRSLWDRAQIAAGFRHLDRAAHGERVTAYHLEAGIAACHASAPSFAETDWPRILELYDDLLARVPSPVVALNRVVALAQVHGPERALRDLEPIESDPLLARYYLLPATRAALHERCGERAEAAAAYAWAAALAPTLPERVFLERRRDACAGVSSATPEASPL